MAMAMLTPGAATSSPGWQFRQAGFAALLALPMAMLRPLRSNISRSLGWSPMVAIAAVGILRYRASRSMTEPLLAVGWVTSR